MIWETLTNRFAVYNFPTIVPPNRFLGKGVRFGYSTVSFRAPFLSFRQD